MKQSEVLQACADMFEKHPERWTRGAFFRDIKGMALHRDAMAETREQFLERAGPNCKMCAMGAVYYNHDGDMGESRPWLRDAINTLKYDKRDLWIEDFNDDSGRTVQDIIIVFKKAAELARAEEG